MYDRSMNSISSDSRASMSILDVITDPQINERIHNVARQQHKGLYEIHAQNMLPAGLEWRVRSIGRSAVAWVLDRQIEEFYQHFNSIHHIAGMHELGLQAGDSSRSVSPDFIRSGQTASYGDGFQIPGVLEPYVGTEAVKEYDSLEDTLRVGLVGERYYANTVSSWNQRRDLWEKADDGRRYYSLAATIYRITDRDALFYKNNLK